MQFLRLSWSTLKTHRRWAALAVLLIAVIVAPSATPPTPNVSAQAQPQLVLSNILVQSLASDSAAITWTTNVPADSEVFYGTTTDYEIPSLADSTLRTQHRIVLQPLTEQTTYHYKVKSQAGTQIVESVDRTFRTPAASGDTTVPTILNLTVSANNVSATATFNTSKPARTTLNYGPTPSVSEGTVSDDIATSHELQLPQTSRPALQGNTIYYYQIRAEDSLGNNYTTAVLTFRTSGSAFDRTFTTGGCITPEGTVEIGGCYQGQFCDGGTLVTDCTKCGAACSANQTCQAGGSCVNDPSLTTNIFQCNRDQCYNDDQSFKNPAPAGCWRSWPRCSANVVLRVQRDRVCGQWMSCSISQQVTATDGSKIDICTGLGACSSLGPGGTCNQFLGQGQCSGDPMRFCNTNADCAGFGGECITVTNPTQKYLPVTYPAPQVDESTTEKIKNLSGAINVGLDWQTENRVIQGQYPWFLAPQYGEALSRFNERGDFESNARSQQLRGSSDPGLIGWRQVGGQVPGPNEPATFRVALEVPNLSEGQNNLNHVLEFVPGAGGTGRFFGPNDNEFQGLPSLSYFLKFRAKSSGTNSLRPQIGFNCVDLDSPCGGYRDAKSGNPVIALTANWQEFRLGPVTGINGNSVVNFFVPTSGSVDAIQIDDVSVSAVLEVRPGEFLFPSCRLYAQGDAEACTYITQEGVKYTGQSGYCLEKDPRNPNICLSWWPVDAIRGEVNAFGTERSAGYGGPVPLYYCLQSRLYVQKPDRYKTAKPQCLDGGGGSCEERDCERDYERRKCQGNTSCDGENGLCPAGYRVEVGTWACGNTCERGGAPDDCSYYCVAKNAAVTSQLTEFTGTGSEVVLPGSSFVQRCALIAKVADVGQNAAWANRTLTSSTYQVPSLQADAFDGTPPLPTYARYPAQSSSLSYPIDYPFAQLVRPNNSTDPANWASIQIRATCDQVDPANPLACATTDPPQVPGTISGSAGPYGWTNQATAASSNASCSARDASCVTNVACIGASSTCSNDGTACVADNNCRIGSNYRSCTFTAPNDVGTCSGTSTACNLNNRVCSHDRTTVCTNDTTCSNAQAGSVCLTPDAQCNTATTCDAIGSSGRKQCKTNGNGIPFTSTNGEGRCSDAARQPTSQACNSDADCGVAVSFCKQTRSQSSGVVTGRCANPSGVEDGRSCVTDADCSFCIQPKFCQTAADCAVSVCEPPKVCQNTSTTCTAPIGATGDPACAAGVPCVAQNPGFCSNAPAQACAHYSECFGASNVCRVAQGTCQNSSTRCDADIDCKIEYCAESDSNSGRCQLIQPGVVAVDSVDQAVDRLKQIFATQYGVWYWNTNRSTPQYEKCTTTNCNPPSALGSGPYADSATNFFTQLDSWRVPDQICPGTPPTRPAANPSNNSDFCGIPPRVFNEQWQGGQRSLTINRGQQVTLNFNTEADPEQKPLKQIFIDWKGDGTAIQSYSFPYDSKSNPADPHVFRYAYSSSSLSSVTYQPRILVMDNWGWCNNGQSGTICSTSLSSWQQLNVTVIVQ